MQLLTVTTAPIYLPYDTAPIAFGEPLAVTSMTNPTSDPIVVTVDGYQPTDGDKVSFSVQSGGYLPTSLTAGTTYYVGEVSGITFELSASSSFTAIDGDGTGDDTSDLTCNVLAEATSPITLPFKPNNTVLAWNLSSSHTVVIEGAPDLGDVSGDPQGPDTDAEATLVTLAEAGSSGAVALISLSYDWLYTSEYTAYLTQN